MNGEGFKSALKIFVENAKETFEFFMWTLVFIMFVFSIIFAFVGVREFVLWLTGQSPTVKKTIN